VVASFGTSTLPGYISSGPSSAVSQTNAVYATTTLFGGNANTSCWLQSRLEVQGDGLQSSFYNSRVHAITTVGAHAYATVANTGSLKSSNFIAAGGEDLQSREIQLACQVRTKPLGSSVVRVEGYSIVKMPLGVPHFENHPRNKFVRGPASRVVTSHSARGVK
jgi:hypothetical protein